MKNALLIAALTLSSVSAFATKAREGVLLDAQTVNPGWQYILVRPSLMGWTPDQATIEFGPTRGPTSAAHTTFQGTSSNAEGGIIRSMGDNKWGVYLGNQPSLVEAGGLMNGGYTGVAGTVTADLAYFENPLNVLYSGKSGDMLWGANLYYASSTYKNGSTGLNAPNKKSASGLAVSVDSPDFWAILNLGLGAESKRTATGDESGYKGKSSYMLGGGMWMENIVPYAYYISNAGEHIAAGGTTAEEDEQTIIKVGVESKVKGDGHHFYYGTYYMMLTEKDKTNDQKVEANNLKLYMGVEADAASWLVLRASMNQSVLVGSTKVNFSGAGETDTLQSNTTVAAGAGFKFNKFLLDWMMTAGTMDGGTLSTTNFGSNAALTYYF